MSMQQALRSLKVASVQLCTRSWYGHPEATTVEGLFQQVKDSDGYLPQVWNSGLRCWNLFDDGGQHMARAYEPTEKTRHWVWTCDTGSERIQPLISLDKLMALMVAWRLKGGLDL